MDLPDNIGSIMVIVSLNTRHWVSNEPDKQLQCLAVSPGSSINTVGTKVSDAHFDKFR
jgi:hypothetical protein